MALVLVALAVGFLLGILVMVLVVSGRNPEESPTPREREEVGRGPGS